MKFWLKFSQSERYAPNENAYFPKLEKKDNKAHVFLLVNQRLKWHWAVHIFLLQYLGISLAYDYQLFTFLYIVFMYFIHVHWVAQFFMSFT